MKREDLPTKESTVTFAELVQFPVITLTSTDDDTFWWTSNKFEKRFIHEKARAGQKFTDGNNGDRWLVIASDADHKRLVVKNLSQHWLGPRIVIWP